MTEFYQLLGWLMKIAVVVVMAILYRIGGWKNKVYRRFAMPVLYFIGCSIVFYYKTRSIFNEWFFVAMLLEIVAMHLGYGKHNDKLKTKLWLRFRAGLAVALAFFPYGYYTYRWSLYALHCICSISFSMLLGTFNESPEGAAGEEATIGLGYHIFPIMMI